MAVRSPVLTPEEAKQLHHEALIIDYNPPATTGLLFTDSMREALDEWAGYGMTRVEAAERLSAMAVREVQTSADARADYMAILEQAGVTIANATYGSLPPKLDDVFEKTVTRVAEARAFIDAFDGELVLVTSDKDIGRVQEKGKRGIIINFQDTLPFGTELDRIDLFYNMGLRVVQLTYNLRNFVGDGCTETHRSGLTYFGRDVVAKLNELNMMVDVSHCSPQVGWDTLEVSNAPIVVTHSCSATLSYHDRGKDNDLARAIADRGGFFGVVVIPGFLQTEYEATLDDFADHVEHMVNTIGIDHVGISTDKAGPGGGTSSLIEYPESMLQSRPGTFNWSGFRPKEHRNTEPYHMVGYDDIRDWPNLTLKLAERGFNEEELRKLLGLNYRRVSREIVG
jgi:membrane dipeptidase